MIRRVARSLSLVLAASAVYLAAQLCGYVFDIGNVERHRVESASYIFATVALATALARGQANPAAWLAPIGERSRWLTVWLTVGFMSAAGLLYGNTISLGMFSDDFVLARGALAGQWFPQIGFVRPLPLGVWGLILATTRSPTVLHVFSIGLHGLNAALVGLLAMRVGLPFAGAIAAGALFLAFPSSVEAVVWPAAVHDLIVAACGIGFLLIAGRPATRSRVVAATSLLVVALLSKESAIAVPFLALVLWLDLQRPHGTPGWPVLVAGMAAVAFYGVVRMALFTIPDSYAQEPTRYMMKELLARTTGTLALPWTTAVFSSWPVIPFLWAVGCVAALAAYAWRPDKTLPVQTILRCVIAMFVAVLPMYTVLFITADLENGRHIYLATAFWVIALIGLISTPDGLTRPPALVVGVAFVVGAVGVQWHLTPWREAARVRDRVLASAEDVLKMAPCTAVSMAGAPDSVRGAYVFRNGLAEAIAFRTGAAPADTAGGCAFVWNGSAFQRTGSLSVPVQATFTR